MSTVGLCGWPQYESPAEALRHETSTWEPTRLDAAKRHYDELDGELGAHAIRLAIAIIDANEPAEDFSMLKVYDELFDDSSAALFLVNYDNETPPERTEAMLTAIRQQGEETGVQAAISVAGYNKRLFGQLRQDAWDIGVIHGLRNDIDVPIVGVSNDFDLRSASPNYWLRMTRNEHIGKPARMWSSKVVPETYGPPDATVNKFVRYLFAVRGLMTDITGKTLIYGASTATTMETFASTKGWVGPLTGEDAYGAMEPSQLALNILERASASPVTIGKDDRRRAIMTHAHSISNDDLIVVSGRRETVEYATYFGGEPYPKGLVNTRSDNTYRRRTPEELAVLVESVQPTTERTQSELARLEEVFREGLDEEISELMGRWMRVMREQLELPELS